MEEKNLIERIKSLTEKEGEVYLTDDDKLQMIQLVLKDELSAEEAVDAIYVEKYAPIRDALEELLNVSRSTRREVRNFGDLDVGTRGKVKLPKELRDIYAKEDIKSCEQYIKNIASKVDLLLCYGEELEKIYEGAVIDKNMDNRFKAAIVKAVYGDIDFFEEELAGDIYDEDKKFLIQRIEEGMGVQEVVNELFELKYKPVINEKRKERTAKYKKADRLKEKGEDSHEVFEEAQQVDLEIARLNTYKDYLKIFAKKEYSKAHPAPKKEKTEKEPAVKEEVQTSAETPAAEGEAPSAVVEALAERVEVVKPAEKLVSPIPSSPEYKFTEKELKVLAEAGYDTVTALLDYISRKGYALVKAGAAVLVETEERLERREASSEESGSEK